MRSEMFQLATAPLEAYQAREHEVLHDFRSKVIDLEVRGTIRARTVSTGQCWIARLTEAGVEITDSAKAILLSPEFERSYGDLVLNFSVVSGLRIGVHGPKFSTIIQNARVIGLVDDLPPASACMLLEELATDWRGLPRSLRMMHRPVNVDGQDRRLTLVHEDAVYRLDSASPDDLGHRLQIDEALVFGQPLPEDDQL